MKATHQPTTTPASDPMCPSVLLRGAALYLFWHGWTQGQFFEPLDDTNQPFLPACASGAIMTAAHGYCPNFGMLSLDADDTAEAAPTLRAMRMLATYLDPEYVGDAFSTSAMDVIGDWNDEQDRTVGEVIETLMEAANDWEAAHSTGGAP